MKKTTGVKLELCKEVESSHNLMIHRGRYTYYIHYAKDGTELLYRHDNRNENRLADSLIAYKELYWDQEWCLPDY